MDYLKNLQELRKLNVKGEEFKDLSDITWKACRANNLTSVPAIIDFINKGGQITSLKYCGRKAKSELNELFERIKDRMSIELYEELKLKFLKIKNDSRKRELFNSNFYSLLDNLSVRSRNGYLTIIKDCNNSIDKILDKVIFKYIDFESYRNIGKKSINELELLKKNVHKLIVDLAEKDIEEIDNPVAKINLLLVNKTKKELLRSDFNSLFNLLSVRARNGCLRILKDDEDKMVGFIERTLIKNLSFDSIPNVGRRACKELDLFRDNLKSSIADYSKKEIDEYDLTIKILENFIGSSFDEIENPEFKLKFSIKRKEVDLIYFFDYYILEHFIKKDIDKLLLTRYLSPRNYQIITNEEIAKKVGLTRERVRQLSTKSFFNRRFLNLKILAPYSYNINSKLNQAYFKVELPENLNKKNLIHLEYSASTLTRILDTILSDYSVIYEGYELKAILSHKGTFKLDIYKLSRALKINYVFSKEFINLEICLEILNEVFKKICSKIEEDYHYDPYLNLNLSIEQKDFLNKLITENFNLSITSEGVLLRRNTKIKTEELIEEVLRKADKPLLIEDILESLKTNYPEKFKGRDVESIRSIFIRFKDKFIYLRASKGRKTQYGLKEWEKTKNLKGGSIKQLCIDYLKSKSTPVHMLELSRYILRNRETNQYNILSNLKLDPHDNFVYYKSRFIGLKKKKI